MFNFNHYVPVLRWKQAERLALRYLYPKDKSCITPLIEIVPNDFIDRESNEVVITDEIFEKKVNEIEKNWGREPIFLDLWLTNSILNNCEGQHPIKIMLFKCIDRGLTVIPVTGIGRGQNYQKSILEMLDKGIEQICFRILIEHLNQSNFDQTLYQLINYFNLNEKSINLIIDYRSIYGQDNDYLWVCNQIPNLENYFTFSIISGAFPQDLSELEKNRQHTLSRFDWLTWENQSSNLQKRIPSFGDYTIQHGCFYEKKGFLNFSASIRYTHEVYWIIMRGEGVFNENGPGYKQWPANAQLLCERPEFCGEDFSLVIHI